MSNSQSQRRSPSAVKLQPRSLPEHNRTNSRDAQGNVFTTITLPAEGRNGPSQPASFRFDQSRENSSSMNKIASAAEPHVLSASGAAVVYASEPVVAGRLPVPGVTGEWTQGHNPTPGPGSPSFDRPASSAQMAASLQAALWPGAANGANTAPAATGNGVNNSNNNVNFGHGSIQPGGHPVLSSPAHQRLVVSQAAPAPVFPPRARDDTGDASILSGHLFQETKRAGSAAAASTVANSSGGANLTTNGASTRTVLATPTPGPATNDPTFDNADVVSLRMRHKQLTESLEAAFDREAACRQHRELEVAALRSSLARLCSVDAMSRVPLGTPDDRVAAQVAGSARSVGFRVGNHGDDNTVFLGRATPPLSLEAQS